MTVLKAKDFEYSYQGQTLWYTILIDTIVRVRKVDNTLSDAIKIPSTVTYDGKTYSVTSIGDCAFWGCVGLTSVTIGN